MELELNLNLNLELDYTDNVNDYDLESDDNYRRKVGDNIEWESIPVGVTYGLNEIFNLKQNKVAEILSTNNNNNNKQLTSCFGKLNLRNLRAWKRIEKHKRHKKRNSC
ncbi:hypothetical protein CANARDRAFT_30420 [[Candida] arabinofermentans NRRL YB-2248]|uniref:Uncharacterized protein n=1 Tax=[Candida] arabinofermentans NRRL YB-2248 TaxID=983967 RepID=A0A1E4STX0_9ASCO|nr:hypothetical protein CANARDRAFT_30420 [[Candida] arabinofermentans NRRL YB-2248]